MTQPHYSIVIATYQRPEPLRRALESIRGQTTKPERVIIVDASEDAASEKVAADFSTTLGICYLKKQPPSSAVQRNCGVDLCESPLVVFMDDDAVLSPATMEQLAAVFDLPGENVGGVAGRMEGFAHPRPRGLLWAYYRWQAGYYHPTYGARLFGPAINCLPCYEEQEGELIRADWFPTACAMYRTELVRRERFPNFSGYSFMEDVHLSARIAKTHTLYFHATALFQHEDAPSPFKVSRRLLARHRLINQRRVAVEVMGQSGVLFELKFFIHRLFATISVLRRRPSGWVEELIGIWT